MPPSQAESLNVERDCTNQNINASENFEDCKIIDKEKDGVENKPKIEGLQLEKYRSAS